ncbi:hypothetical protein ACIBI9_63600 [Nonomuraea sp. NPDC050451]|uniref:hypothetical protein n=1 Tax=Nonomuraea sp. NPDC050451 TaxID=3364364 RepID=UPI00378ED7E0
MFYNRGNVRADVKELDGGVQVSVLVGQRERQAGLDVAPDVDAVTHAAQERGPVHVGVDGSIPHVDLQGSQYVKSHDLPPLVVPEI